MTTAAAISRGNPADGLFVAGHSPVHRLPAQAKIVSLLLVVALVVLTPAGAWGVLAGQAALVVAVAASTRLPAVVVVRRLAMETPFVLFAVLLPFVAAGPRTEVGPISLSIPGLVGGATLLVKATVGMLAAVVLAATTPARDLVAGLERLRIPAVLVAILSFMVRYLVLVAEDLQRTDTARLARCGDKAPLRAVASGVGIRFVRTYERGERVQQAMLARGYTGRMPAFADVAASGRQWALALSLPAAVFAVALVGQGLNR